MRGDRRVAVAIVEVDGKYFVYFGADKELLRRAGFELPR
jgi:hypothetical protein